MFSSLARAVNHRAVQRAAPVMITKKFASHQFPEGFNGYEDGKIVSFSAVSKEGKEYFVTGYEGEFVMNVLRRHNFPFHDYDCGGVDPHISNFGTGSHCTACMCKIPINYANTVQPPDSTEDYMLDMVLNPEDKHRYRLSCSIELTSLFDGCRLFMVNVDSPDHLT